MTLPFLAGVLLASSTAASSLPTTSPAPLPPERIRIGGPETCSSEGFDDPARLSDGVTEAAALYTLRLDRVAATLEVVVENTSPVTSGVPNPVLSSIWFNTPLAVTGMTLASQTSSGGAAPAFTLSFDADTMTAPNPNGLAPFGAFNVRLSQGGGVSGSIANAAADTLGGPPGSMVTGPVTFLFDLTGNLAGLTSEDFTRHFSVPPPGNKPTNGAGRFQSGGTMGASGNVSSPATECFLVVSPFPGDDPWLSPGPSQHMFPTYLGPVARYFGVTLSAPLEIPVDQIALVPPPMPSPFRLGSGGLIDRSASRSSIERLFVQVNLWNPTAFPNYPEQTSHGIELWVWPDGTFTATPYGLPDGMTMTVEPFTGPDGRPYLRFPFTVTEN